MVPATIISSAVQASLTSSGTVGVVESVHRRAVNIRVRGGLVTLAWHDAGPLPNGILVPAGSPLGAWGLHPGSTVRLDRQAIAGGGPGNDRSATLVDLSVAASWSPWVRTAPWATRPVRPDELDVAERTVADHPSGIDDATRLLVVGVVRALAAHDADAALLAGMRLIGRGPGLTPAGDDVLVGASAALWMGNPRLAEQVTRAWACRARGRTTPVAEALLEHAAHGAFAGRMHDVLEALVGVRSDLPAVLERALAWGATSGADTLAGLLAGFRALRASPAGAFPGAAPGEERAA